MNTSDLHSAAHSLLKDRTERLPGVEGRRIEVLSGCVWVTIDNDLRDIVLSAGEGFYIDRPGRTLLSAVTDARYLLLT